jgi:hypothetical protein
MKSERARRYRDKLDLIILRAGQAQTWLDEEFLEDFLADDRMTRRSVQPTRPSRKQ